MNQLKEGFILLKYSNKTKKYPPYGGKAQSKLLGDGQAAPIGSLKIKGGDEKSIYLSICANLINITLFVKYCLYWCCDSFGGCAMVMQLLVKT